MHKDMDGLWELQQIDAAIGELQADLKALDDGTELRAQLAAAEEELARRSEVHSELLAAQGKLEAELEKAETKRKSIMQKAYSGTISNPKELETLEMEIESFGRTKDRCENQLLELFDQVDSAGQALEEQEKLVAGLNAKLEETLKTHESETARINQRVAGLREEREAAKGNVDASSLARYEQIRGRAGNAGVVRVEDGMCSGCRVMLPVVQIAELRRGDGLKQCESCMRLLWIRVEE